MITRITHANIVCTDIKRSVRFYCDILGAKVISPLRVESSPEISKGLKFDVPASYQAYLLSFGGGSTESPATLIDLLQWLQPPVTGEPYDCLNHAGIARICLAVDDIDKTYEELKAKGVEFLTPPVNVVLRPGHGNSMPHRICCFKDPDGVILELAAPLE